MALFRQVHIDFWQDGFVLELTPEEKYFYLYLMTNSKTSQCGIYELPYKIMETETGYNRETVEKLIKRFEDYGKIIYNEPTKEIFMNNWIKYNKINSPKVKKCIEKELNKIKYESFIRLFVEQCDKYGYSLDSISIPYTYSIDTASKDYGEEQELITKNKNNNKNNNNNKENDVVVIEKIKSYFPLNNEEITKIVNAFKETDKDIKYLEEKLILTKETDCKSVVGFLIKAIKENYMPNKTNKCNVTELRPKHYKNGAGAFISKEFAGLTPEEINRRVKESQALKFGKK